MSSIARSTLRSMARAIRPAGSKVALPIHIVKQNFASAKEIAAAAAEAEAARASLAKDARKKIAEYRLRKPSLEDRMAKSEQLYSNKKMSEVDASDVGQYIAVNVNDVPPAYRRLVEKELTSTGGYWMVREESLKAIEAIEKLRDRVTLPLEPSSYHPYPQQCPSITTIYGLRGTGKTFVTSQVLKYAQEKKWIVFGTSGEELVDEKLGFIRQEGNIFMQTLYCREFLQYFASTFQSQLEQIPLVGEYNEWNWIEAEDSRYNAPQTPPAIITSVLPYPHDGSVVRPTGPGKTLYDLAALGAWRADLAADVWDAVVVELKNQTIVPVLFAIDSINKFDTFSGFYDPSDSKNRIHARRLNTVIAMEKLFVEPPKRGAVLLTTSHLYTQHRVPEFLKRASTNIRVYSYTSDQLQSALEHYSVSKHIITPLDTELLRRSEVLTGGVPLDLYKFCLPQ